MNPLASFVGILGMLGTIGCAAPSERFWVESDGAFLPVHVEGPTDAETMIVFLHGGPGDSALGLAPTLGSDLLSPLVDHDAWVLFDARCAGQSQGNCNPGDLSLEAYSRDIDRVLDVLDARYDADRYVLVGHSFGGILGTHFLIDPDRHARIAAWIEISGSHAAYLTIAASASALVEVGTEQIAMGHSVEAWEEDIAVALNADVTVFAEAAEVNQRAYIAMERLVADGVVTPQPISVSLNALFDPWQSLYTASWNESATSGSAFGVEHISYNPDDAMDGITVPTLLQYGRYDLVVPPALGEHALKHLGGPATLIVYEDSRHSPFVDTPERWRDDVLDFLDTVR